IVVSTFRCGVAFAIGMRIIDKNEFSVLLGHKRGRPISRLGSGCTERVVHTTIICPCDERPGCESCLIQDEPGEGGGFSYKMSLEERSRMLGLDHQRAHIGTLEPGADSGLFRRQWRGRIQGTESGGGLRLGESDATAATV